MEPWFEFLTDPEIQKSLSWLGGGFTAAGAAIWAVIKYLYPKGSENPSAAVPQNRDASSSVSANRSGTAIGGNLTISGPTIHQGPNRLSVVALGLAVLGIVTAALAFAGNRIEADNSSAAVGGYISGSTITINSQGSER